MELIILALLLVVLARLPRKQPSTADRGLWLPVLRMGTAVLVVVLIGLLMIELV